MARSLTQCRQEKGLSFGSLWIWNRRGLIKFPKQVKNCDFEDTFNNRVGTKIDGQIIRSLPVYYKGAIIGYKPNCGPKENSDYMSLYSEPFVQQLQKWVQNESLIPLNNPVIASALGDVQMFKSTIEPKKPRGMNLNNLMINIPFYKLNIQYKYLKNV